jgi:VanZ family protein
LGALHKRVAWGAVLLWMAVIFLGSAQTQLPQLTPGAPHLQEVLGHVGEYAVLGGLLTQALKASGVRHPLLWAIVLAAAYGVSDEFHQGFVAGRDRSATDWLMDLGGSILGGYLVSLLNGRLKRGAR